MTDKVNPIHDCIFYCHSGSAAYIQTVADVVSYQFGFRSTKLNEPPTVHTTSLLEMCYWYLEDLMAGIIIADWDPQEGGQRHLVSIVGMMIRQSFATGDPGSPYIYGYLESMTKEECLQFIVNNIALAPEWVAPVEG